MIVNRVSRLLGERRESVADLARGTGLAYKTAHELYNDKSRRIDFDTLNRLCGYLGVGVGDILEYVPDPTPADAEGPPPA